MLQFVQTLGVQTPGNLGANGYSAKSSAHRPPKSDKILFDRETCDWCVLNGLSLRAR